VLPAFSAGDFAAGAAIDNPFHPLVPGTVRRYEADVRDPESGETTREVNVVTVTSQTKTIAGVAARVVRDRAFEDGVLAEDTLDYYAQDKRGNVWYLGEDTKAFEYDDDGNVVSTSTRGSWRAGVRGAKPGFIMPAERTVGFSYYQEFAQQDQAVDQAKIVSLDESMSTPAGNFTGVLKTDETTEVEPGVLENKFYARGVGEVMVFEEVDASGQPLNRIPLVSITTEAAVPLPPGAWAALAATGLLLVARGCVSLIGDAEQSAIPKSTLPAAIPPTRGRAC
jgi:hypothetical protein